MEPQVKGYLAIIGVIVVTGLVVVAISLGKFGQKAKKLTDGAEKVVQKVSAPIEKAVK